jgi:hypothetical protein
MAEIHGFLARIVLVLVLVTAAWSIGLLATRRPIRPAIVGGLIWVAGLLVLTTLVGAVTALTSHVPKDLLHLVYGALVLTVLPIAWAIGRSRADARRAVLVLSVASVVQVILVVRLFATGG